MEQQPARKPVPRIVLPLQLTSSELHFCNVLTRGRAQSFAQD